MNVWSILRGVSLKYPLLNFLYTLISVIQCAKFPLNKGLKMNSPILHVAPLEPKQVTQRRNCELLTMLLRDVLDNTACTGAL